MTSAPFSGDSRYTATLSASRSGFTITARLDVSFSGGTAAWTGYNQLWASNIGSSYVEGYWTYDFRYVNPTNVWLRSLTFGPGTYLIGGWADMEDKGRGYPANFNIVIPPGTPSAPSTPTITRVSDTSQTVAWTRNATANAPYSSQQVQRRGRSGTSWGAWSTVHTVSTQYTGTGSNSVTLTVPAFTEYQYRIAAINSSGTTYSGTASYTFDTPTAPSTPTITRVSDVSQTVAWNRTATATRPYTSQQLQRREYSNGAWSAWAGVNTVSTGYSNAGANSVSNATVANRYYQYRVKATNPAGEVYSGVSGSVFTTPAAPSAFTATKQTSGAILLELVQAVPHDSYKTTLEYSLNAGSSWTALTTLNAGVTSYNWSSPPTGSAVVVRARVYIDYAGSTGNSLTSAWTQSNSVALTAPPNAPSSLVPNGAVFDASLARTFSWSHNPVDSSVQSAYEIQYRIGAGSWTSTGKITSSTQSRVFAASTFVNGNSYQWQVRTWGSHADPSPWSPTATFVASAPPTVSITSPTDDTPHGESTLLLTWSFSDPEGSAQSMWEAQLSLNGQTLESRSSSGPETSVQFTTTLTDATEYQVQVRGRDGASLWSEWDQVTFTTDFPTPAVPVIAAYAWNPLTGTLSLTIVNEEGDPEVTHNDLFRSLDGGQTWEQIGTVPVNGAGFDPTIPLEGDVMYKVVAWTELPSSSESEVLLINLPALRDQGVIDPFGGFWSAGANFSQVVQMNKGFNNPPKMDLSTGLANKTLHYFAGRTKPVETIGEATMREGDVEFIVSSVAEMRRAREMAYLPAPHLIRLPDGTILYGSIGELSDKRLAEGWYAISFDITEADR